MNKRLLILGTVAAFGVTAAIAVTLEEVDTNADGMITFDEAVVAMPDMTEEIFTAADLNQDGMIDSDELAAAQEIGLIPAS
ncbi:MAG: hypothetical protein AAGA70_17555 [Pseudomonadota bacterium]